jgi:hypothetical protein
VHEGHGRALDDELLGGELAEFDPFLGPGGVRGGVGEGRVGWVRVSVKWGMGGRECVKTSVSE